MSRSFWFIPAAALVVGACDGPAAPHGPDDGSVFSVVLTEGVVAPPFRRVPSGLKTSSTLEDAAPSLGGSSSDPLALAGDGCTEFAARQLTISYTLTGNQASPASFDVYTTWDFNGTTFVGSNATTINLPSKSGGGAVQYNVNITVTNSAETGSGTTSFSVAPFNLVTNTSDVPGLRLSFAASSTAQVHVQFNTCATANTPPTLTLPADITAEATGPAGAVVTFSASASDAEDDDATLVVTCTPVSGSMFPLGETTVNCSVTDSGGETTEGSFKITVVDTTPPDFIGVEDGDEFTRIATNSGGWALDLDDLGISANDLVDGVVEVTCIPNAGTQLAIGAGDFKSEVTCESEDSRGNRSEVTFYVNVTLDLTGVHFLMPLRTAESPSAHKRNSAIPHKFPAPKYADGTDAIDLADGLTLQLTWQSGSGGGEESFDDPAAGSTIWRWDDKAQQYVFNAKTANNWALGTWKTTASYAGITLANTMFVLNR